MATTVYDREICLGVICGLSLLVLLSAPGEIFLQKAAEFCPHHVGHYLGMDTHDTHMVSRSLGLHPGMVITVEPGIYISEDNQEVPERYRGIGIRIEDDVLITENGAEVLTAECPKEVEEIERLMSATAGT